MARKIVPKRRGRTVESNAPLTIVIEGGLPGGESLDTRLSVLNDTGNLRRIRVLGGLPNVLQGMLMTPEQRKEHDDQTYKAVFGGSLNYQPAPAAPTPTKEQQP